MTSADKTTTKLFLGFVLLLSYFTYVHNFWNPPALFWDENYHIASAQKEINGIYFMEPHPPLGKMFIALGEVLLNRNPVDNQFIGTDYATNPPPGFSFAGYRLFPVIFGWLSAAVLFMIFVLITRRPLWALLLSFLYIFDNALIVHSRSAMLDSTMIFFSLIFILSILLANEHKDHRKKFFWISMLSGVSFACVMTTKVFGLVLILLLPLLAWLLYPKLKTFGRYLVVAGISFAAVYCSVWYLHFAIGTTVNPQLPDSGYYQASPAYHQILDAHKTRSILSFPVMLKDSLHFVSHYERGVPSLDLCKADENGSPWFLWPFGGRTINYRWETPDGQMYKYLTLQINPVVWGMGLVGLLLTLVMIINRIFATTREKTSAHTWIMVGLFITYVGFMGAISTIDRVLYMYHYFLPLLLSLLLFAYAFTDISHLAGRKLSDAQKTGFLLVLALFIFGAFEFFRPLSLYEPISDTAFQKRSLLKIWELSCVRCERESLFVSPR